MNNKEKISELLNSYISENKKIRDEYSDLDIKLSLYSELISYLVLDYDKLNSNKLNIDILLNSIYNTNDFANVFYVYMNQMLNGDFKGMQDFIDVIKKDYEDAVIRHNTLASQIKNNKNKASSAYRVRLAIKNNTPILESKYDVYNVKRIINYYETIGIIDRKEDLLLCNEIEYYNRNLKSVNSTERGYASNLYNEIPNILNGGFEEFDEIEVSRSRKERLDKYAKEIKNFIDYEDDVSNSFEEYRKFIQNESEFSYVVNEVMKSYVYDLLEYYEIIMDQENYMDISLRREAVSAYYKLLDKFLDIRKYYEKISEVIVTQEEVSEDVISEGVRNLVFSHPVSNPMKSRLTLDMKNVPHEYYESVYDLLTRFINGKVSSKEFKNLSSNNRSASGYTELKDDQVRIVTKHVKDNIYCVVGVFVKKSDNDMIQYKTMFNRLVCEINDDRTLEMEIKLGKITMDELSELVSEKARKGTR